MATTVRPSLAFLMDPRRVLSASLARSNLASWSIGRACVAHRKISFRIFLKAAVNIIDTALATADGSTAPGWVRLRARRGQLAGLLHRATVGRPTGEFDADGYPVYAAPHHPTNPRRSRPRRFVG